MFVLVELDDLTFGPSSNEGKYLLCRLLPRPSNLSTPLNICLSLLVASPSSSSIRLELHNYPLLPASLGRPTGRDIDAVFPPDSFVVLKEPRLKIDAVHEGKPTEIILKVDGPSDVVQIEASSPLLKGVEWKTAGTKDGRWEGAKVEERELEEWKDVGNKVCTNPTDDDAG